jgi:hypothetical protein
MLGDFSLHQGKPGIEVSVKRRMARCNSDATSWEVEAECAGKRLAALGAIPRPMFGVHMRRNAGLSDVRCRERTVGAHPSGINDRWAVV